MSHFSFEKVSGIKDWVEDTWIERDASKVLLGLTDDHWRIYPDVDVLSFIAMENTNKVPLVWIDGNVYYYSEAMKILKNHTKSQTNNINQEIHKEEGALAMTA